MAQETHAGRLIGGRYRLVAVYDVVVENGVPWTVMQLASGYSLAEYVAKYGPLSAEQAGIVAVASSMPSKLRTQQGSSIAM